MGLAWLGREAIGLLREADLTGQVALVTSGSRGLGLLVARELGRQDSRVAICARDPEELARARQLLRPDAGEVVTVVCDVADRAQVDATIAEVRERLGDVEVIVNNAGTIQAGPVHEMTLQDVENAMGTMYWGVVYPTLAVLPAMRGRRGRLLRGVARRAGDGQHRRHDGRARPDADGLGVQRILQGPEGARIRPVHAALQPADSRHRRRARRRPGRSGGPDGKLKARGRDLDPRVRNPIFVALTGWQRSAARRFNEFPGPSPMLDRPHEEAPIVPPR